MKRFISLCTLLIACYGHAQVLTENFDAATLPSGFITKLRPSATPCTAVVSPWLDDVEAHAAPLRDFSESNCWTDTSASSYDWNVGNGSTPSSLSGPSAAFSGTNFFYIEASGSSAGDIAELYTPMVDLSALTVPALEFYYHMYGEEMGELHVDIYDGTTWDNDVEVIIGEQQINDTDPWLRKIIDLTAYSGTIQVRFRAISMGTPNGDISLDDIEFKNGPSCFPPTALTVTNVMAASADLGWISSASLWDIEIINVTAGEIATATPDYIGVSNPYNATGLIANTKYEFYVRAECVSGTSFWAGPFAFTTSCTAVVAPWLDDVEAHTAPLRDFSESNCWTDTSVGSYDWNVGNGSTPSSLSGPSAAFSGTNFFYVEASGSSAGDIAELYTPMVDLSVLTVPALEFYYHMYGEEMGELHVDIYDGTIWNNDVEVIIGEEQTNDTDPWLKKIIDLTAYSGTIQVRFRAISTGTPNGDISLDDIEFKSKSLSVDGDLTMAELSIYPNPAGNEGFFITVPRFSGEKVHVFLYNILGEEVYVSTKTVDTNERISVPTASLPTGVYLVEIKHKGKTFVEKVIVQ